MNLKPTFKQQLIASLLCVWHAELSPDVLQKLIEPMPQCEAVIKANGAQRTISYTCVRQLPFGKTIILYYLVL